MVGSWPLPVGVGWGMPSSHDKLDTFRRHFLPLAIEYNLIFAAKSPSGTAILQNQMELCGTVFRERNSCTVNKMCTGF